MNMDLEIIRKTSGGHGSFGVWRDGDIDDLSIIQDSIEDLHGRVIFVGYNASGPVEPWRNFHFTHRGGRNHWLADTIGRNPRLRGAYMTDFFKGDYAVREIDVGVNAETIKKNLAIFRKEIALFEDDNPVLIAFGHKCHDILTRLGFEPRYLPHYASRISRENFSCKVHEILK